MTPDSLQQQLANMRRYFNSGATLPFHFRKEQLKKLKSSILKYEKDIEDALYSDLKKSREESWVTETGFVIAEINETLRNLREWIQPEKTATNLLNFPSSSFIHREPLGVVLIIAPWNYPFQLLINPLIGAIAAGNCIVLKPSEFASATSAIMTRIINESFPPGYISFIEGDGATIIPSMIKGFRFDHIFYTGSTAIGKVIYQEAAQQLIPVTLELGGKSPCVVEQDANIKVAARRIALAKFSNAGQMCVAPDYLLVHSSKKQELIKALRETIESFFSTNINTSPDYGKIINTKQFRRLKGYLKEGKVLYGGNYDEEKLFMAPTLIDEVSLNDSIMKEEIFGPILPIISFDTKEEALAVIKNHPDPLAFYVYTSSSNKENSWLQSVPFGGGCVNNSSWQLTNYYLPFGGRGNSGIGQYHGKNSFEIFSHRKAIMKTPTWFDPFIKYPPLKGRLKLFKWIVK